MIINFYRTTVFVCILHCFVYADAQTPGYFGNNGIVQTLMSSTGSCVLRDLQLLDDGNLLAVGYAHTGSMNEAALVRYDRRGIADSTFGSDGIVTVSPVNSPGCKAYSTVVQPDGKIIAAGNYQTGTGTAFFMTRLLTDGSVDTSFAVNGYYSRVEGVGFSDNTGYKVLLKPNGQILLAGVSYLNGKNQVSVLQVNMDGSNDSTFGNNGIVTLFTASDDVCNDAVLQYDGKIILAGSSVQGGVRSFAVVRLFADGSADNSFGVNGWSIIQAAGYTAEAFSVCIQPDQKIITGGTIGNSTHADFALLRLNADGSSDTSFGVNGITNHGTGAAAFSNGRKLIVQNDNKILIAGNTTTNGACALMRFNADGSSDAVFGNNGTILQSFAPTPNSLYAMCMNDSGEVICGGAASSGVPDFFYLMMFGNNISTGLHAANEQMHLHVYPNPADDFIRVNADEMKDEEMITVTDIQGRIKRISPLKTMNDDSFVLSTSSLENGMYVISYCNAMLRRSALISVSHK